MEQHSIPRQITTFEFKLIGFMTLRQFLYLVIFTPFGFIVYKIFPIPILNILLGIVTALVGVALAFVPINDRPLEVWIRNFIKRLSSPTQYLFHKNNPPIKIFQNIYFTADPHLISTHIESQEKLSKYLRQTKKNDVDNRKQSIQEMIKNPVWSQKETVKTVVVDMPAVTDVKQPFFTGVVKNNKKIPLPGVLIYIKDANDRQIRLLKTNPHGIFATYNPLSSGDYQFEIIDPKSSYFFDKLKIKIEGTTVKPLEFYSKEIL